MLDQRNWKGPIAMTLGCRLYVNCSDDDMYLERNLAEGYRMLQEAIVDSYPSFMKINATENVQNPSVTSSAPISPSSLLKNTTDGVFPLKVHSQVTSPDPISPFKDKNDGVLFFKTQSLKKLTEFGNKTTADIRAMSKETVSSILSSENFQRFSWSEVEELKYATVSYMVSTKWSTLLDFMLGINGIQSEFVYIDEFCLPGPKKALDKEKVFSVLSKVVVGSSEHHIMEPGSIIQGWTWYDLSLLSPSVRPTLHSSTRDIPLNEMLIDNIRASGFDFVNFSAPEDQDKVRGSIVKRWGTIEKFNERMLATVGTALDLTQVCKQLR